MSVYRGEETDRVPWLIYDSLLPRGCMARKLRNEGLGLKTYLGVFNRGNVYKEEMPHVTIETKTLGNVLYRTYHTPLGDLFMKDMIGGHASTPVDGVTSWVLEYPVKKIRDFEIAEFMIEDTHYIPSYDAFDKAESDLGDDGIVAVWAGRSPFQLMQLGLMGYRNFAITFFRYHKEFRRLYKVLEKKAEERYRIIADSPATIINGGDNISSEIVSPVMWERYIIPFYERQANLLHKKDKVLENHLDGKLEKLKELISETDFDVIEAFTPPPMGDLEFADARSAWKGKTIALNFPENVFLEGTAAIKKQTLKLLSEAYPGGNFLFSITEDIPLVNSHYCWEGLSTITEILSKNGVYPLSKKLAN